MPGALDSPLPVTKPVLRRNRITKAPLAPGRFDLSEGDWQGVLYATTNLSAPTYERPHREPDENQILEFSMLVGHYVMAAMRLDVAGCKVEPAVEPRHPVGPRRVGN